MSIDNVPTHLYAYARKEVRFWRKACALAWFSGMVVGAALWFIVSAIAALF